MIKFFNTITEALKEEDVDRYHLCYIDEIPQTVSDYTEASKKYMSSPEFDAARSKELYGYYDPHIQMIEIPNPDYKEGVSTHYAYFTSAALDKQWGDDWNDAPYDCNAGDPYDTIHDGNNREEVCIVIVPFGIPEENIYDVKFPCDYGCNCPWSVEDINLGAVPWIFIRPERKRSVIINAGIGVEEFSNLLESIK